MVVAEFKPMHDQREKPDLTGSVLAGMALSRGASQRCDRCQFELPTHPPERLPALVAPVLDGSHDVAAGSRYVPERSTDG